MEINPIQFIEERRSCRDFTGGPLKHGIWSA